MGKFRKPTPGKKTTATPKEEEYVSRDMQDYSSEEDDDMGGNMAFNKSGKGDADEEDDDVFNLKGGDSDDSDGDDDDDSEMVSWK